VHIAIRQRELVCLPSERTTHTQACFASGRLADNLVARSTYDNTRSVAKYSGDLEATGATNIHKVGVGALYETLQLVELGFVGSGRVQQVVIRRHRGTAQRVFSAEF